MSSSATDRPFLERMKCGLSNFKMYNVMDGSHLDGEVSTNFIYSSKKRYKTSWIYRNMYVARIVDIYYTNRV